MLEKHGSMVFLAVALLVVLAVAGLRQLALDRPTGGSGDSPEFVDGRWVPASAGRELDSKRAEWEAERAPASVEQVSERSWRAGAFTLFTIEGEEVDYGGFVGRSRTPDIDMTASSSTASGSTSGATPYRCGSEPAYG